jgi:Tol biopolymer transport system component
VLVAMLLLAGIPAAARAAPKFLLQSRPSTGPPPQAPVNSSFTGPGAVAANGIQLCPTQADANAQCDPGGRFVAFSSYADGLSSADDDSVVNVYLRDRVTKRTFLVSRGNGAAGAASSGNSVAPAVLILPGYIFGSLASPPHVLVAFTSAATNLTISDSGILPGSDSGFSDANGHTDVYVRDVVSFDATSDTETGVTALASNNGGTASPGTGNEDSQDPAMGISGGHPIVAFDSASTNLDSGNGNKQIFIRDLLNNTTHVASVKYFAGPPPAVVQGDDDSFGPVISGDGSTLGYVTDAFFLGANSRAQAAVVPLASGSVGSTPHPEIVSVDNGTPPKQGNQRTQALALDADGQRVAFETRANLLPPDNSSDDNPDIYLRDRGAGHTTLISTPAPGTGLARDDTSFSGSPGIDAAGDRITFDSAATLDPSDGNPPGASTFFVPLAGSDVYVHNLGDGSNAVVSRLAGGGPADGGSARPAVSADGSTVAFSTFGRNLDRGGKGDAERVLDADLNSHALSPVARPSGTPIPIFDDGVNQSFLGTGRSVSDDGRYVVFLSSSDGLSTEDDNRVTNVFVRDNSNGQVTLVSRATGVHGAAANDASIFAVISADGSHVAFVSRATNLGGPADPTYEVYIRDLRGATTALASRSNGPDGAPATQSASEPALSADGSRVAFETPSALTGAPTGGRAQVYTRDLAAGVTRLVSAGSDGSAGNSGSYSPSLDAAGDRIAFWTGATNLVALPQGANAYQVIARDLPDGAPFLVSRATGATGAPSDNLSYQPSVDDAGDRIAFTSFATNLDPADTTMHEKILVRDVAASTTQLVSRAGGPQGAPADDDALNPEISGDGRFVVFASAATNLGTAPAAGFGYFRRELAGGQTRYLSNTGSGSTPATPSPSFDGRCVAFDSITPDLLPSVSLGSDFARVYLWAASGECPNVGPQTRIVAGPSGPTRVRRPVFRFTSSKSGSTFRCRLDRDGFAPCHSPYRPPALADGPHTFSVTATDPAGNGDATPATRTFTVDTHPPALSRLRVSPSRFVPASRSTPITARAHHGARISFRLSEPAKVALAIVRCKSIIQGRCRRPRTIATLKRNGRRGANSTSFTGRLRGKPLGSGHYELKATPTDPAGNRGRTRVVTFVVG